MDKKSKILLTLFFILVIGSMYMTYVRYIANEDIIYFTDPDETPSALDMVKTFLRI
jgi:hypothetical protein